MTAVNRHRPVLGLFSKVPSVGSQAFVAPSATVAGDVTLSPGSSVFYGSVLNGDAGSITVGAGTNIQDRSLIRTAPAGIGEHAADTVIGSNVTIGHKVALHGVTIEDEALIGMGATLSEGVVVRKGSMVAAGAVVAPGTEIPAGQIWGGNPAKFLRALKPNESSFLLESAEHYKKVAAEHLKENSASLEDVARAKGLL